MSNLAAISPFFIVSNLEKSVTFYVNKLGFKVWHSSPADNPFFAIVSRDYISIMLKSIADDIKPIPNNTRHKWARWDAYIYTENPNILFEEYNSAGVTFRQPLQDDNDGLYGFEITDADGYVLFFGRIRK
jgi:catechol 2,3-dioxygenase-like lactoylglutathione lyase family enzyme